jgi:hypothetical protein
MIPNRNFPPKLSFIPITSNITAYHTQ